MYDCLIFQEKPTEATNNFTSSVPANSLVGMDNGSVNGLNPRQMMVYNLIRASTLEQGISKQDIYATLKDKMPNVEFEYVYLVYRNFI